MKLHLIHFLILHKKKFLSILLLMSFLIPVTLSLFSTIGYGEESITIDYESIESEIANELDPYDDSNWYTQKIEMIIITRDQPDEIAVMQKLADWKTSKGVPTKIVNQTEFMTYSGRDTQEKIRNCIKYYYNTYNIKWVLLAGDTNLIPIRYVYNPDTVIVPDFNEEKMGETDKPTDYYYADLTGNWDNNNNGRFGESLVYASADEIDWDPEVYVGRFPESMQLNLTLWSLRQLIMKMQRSCLETDESRYFRWSNSKKSNNERYRWGRRVFFNGPNY
jgi:hypothetical protein